MKKYTFIALICATILIFCGCASAAVPTAGFTANQTQCAVGDSVQFTDQSTGNPTEWAWDFNNDGSVDSTEQNPIHTFNSAGSYTVNLIVKNADGTDYEKKYNYINVGPDLTASIQTPNNPVVNQTYTINYTITNVGQGAATSPFTSWVYCNGKLLNKQTISSLASGTSQMFSFAWIPLTTGTYTFTARADVYTNVTEYNETNNIATQQRDAVILNADFSATPVSGLSPLTVQFTDQSTGNPTSWAWDFNNDGIVDSTEQNPIYTFITDGIYNVKLYVTNAEGSDEEIKAAYIRVGKPDLVTSIQLPINPQTGTTYTIGYTVTNEGTGDAGPFTAWIYINGKLMNKTLINSLIAGSSNVVSFNWTPTTSGIFTFVARSDVYGNLSESNERNNAATQSVTVAPSKPDLVTSIQAPENPKAGDTYTMSYTVTNNGVDILNPFTAWIYYDGKLINKTLISSLASGASRIITFDWTPTTNGTYTFSARSDVYGTVSESNERNNAATQNIYVGVKPDLVTSIQLPESPQVGQTYTMSYTVTNNGSDAGPFTAWIYYDGKLLNKTVISSLAGGANQIITFDWIPTTTGTYTFSARADVYGTVSESNEQNNAALEEIILV